MKLKFHPFIIHKPFLNSPFAEISPFLQAVSFSISLLKKNGLRHMRFHDLRHTCASLMLNNGEQVSLKEIQMWLGHSDFSTTANIYSHVDASSKKKMLNVMSTLVQN